jgi:hypothetical protein
VTHSTTWRGILEQKIRRSGDRGDNGMTRNPLQAGGADVLRRGEFSRGPNAAAALGWQWILENTLPASRTSVPLASMDCDEL